MAQNRREIVRQAVGGVRPDRVPFSFWYHFRTLPWFPLVLTPEFTHVSSPASSEALQTYITRMAEAEVAFWRRYQPDILKVMHDIPYEMPADLTKGVQEIEDWARLPLLPPDTGHFGTQLETLRRIRADLPEDVPMIETVFNAFYYANKISQGRLQEHLQRDPQSTLRGIGVIQETLIQYAKASLQICDGIYYALSGASEDTAPRELYEKYFRSLDKQLLEAVADAPLNVLHLHGYGELYGDLIADMPAAMICWSDRSSNLSLREGRRLFQRCIMGGLNEVKLPQYTPEQVRAEAQDALQQAGESGLILSPGCAVATDIRPELLDAIGEAVK